MSFNVSSSQTDNNITTTDESEDVDMSEVKNISYS